MPPIKDYYDLLFEIYENRQLTNQGPLLNDFEIRIKKMLGLRNFQYVANGTLALQLALRSLDLDNDAEIITTPFSYVATSSAILWEKYKPVFVDINDQTFNIDPKNIKSAITKNTKAILAVHVFGNPCEIETIESIAAEYELDIIYDGAHAFGVNYKGKSIFNYGDISTCSFHATKVFHTVEGGGIFTNHNNLNKRIDLMKRFGHNGDDHYMLGINAKSSELHAAMGLCNIKYYDENLSRREYITKRYDRLLNGKYKKQQINDDANPNFGYYPIVFDTANNLHTAITTFNELNIYPRRYFHPSLNRLPYLEQDLRCPISEDISSRVLCLPLYEELNDEEITKVCEVLA